MARLKSHEYGMTHGEVAVGEPLGDALVSGQVLHARPS